MLYATNLTKDNCNVTTIGASHWQVRLIDVGLTRIVDINQLWQLPEHFKTVPRQVNVRSHDKIHMPVTPSTGN